MTPIKNVHKIKFYSFLEFGDIFRELGQKGILKRQDLRELFFVTPLLLSEVRIQKKELLWGKLVEQNNPFDVVIASKRSVEDALKNMTLKSPLFLQVKELRIFRQQSELSVEEWTTRIQEEINKIHSHIKLEPPEGILYFVSCILVKSFIPKDFEDNLLNIQFPSSFPYSQVVLATSFQNVSDLSKAFNIWQLYPKVHRINLIPVPKKKIN